MYVQYSTVQEPGNLKIEHEIGTVQYIIPLSKRSQNALGYDDPPPAFAYHGFRHIVVHHRIR